MSNVAADFIRPCCNHSRMWMFCCVVLFAYFCIGSTAHEKGTADVPEKEIRRTETKSPKLLTVWASFCQKDGSVALCCLYPVVNSFEISNSFFFVFSAALQPWSYAGMLQIVSIRTLLCVCKCSCSQPRSWCHRFFEFSPVAFVLICHCQCSCEKAGVQSTTTKNKNVVR